QKDDRLNVYAATDRFDSSHNKRRCARNQHYKLILNCDTQTSIHKKVEYRNQMQTMQVLDSLNSSKSNNEYFSFWYQPQKSEYEFYDIINDPYELNNLIDDSSLVDEINALKSSLENWMRNCTYDAYSETQILDLMYPDKIIPLKSSEAIIEQIGQSIIIRPSINGASIGYKKRDDSSWNTYEKGQVLLARDVHQVIQFKPGFETNTVNITQQ
ncbi:MAG: hypothetical protein CL850_04155, partial [Crocinitomicaceae bacterium]|nr:hypothetical protein [Crocinitomicaceae bacterium]